MAISIAELEEAAALSWRAPEEDRLGGWLLRAGFTDHHGYHYRVAPA